MPRSQPPSINWREVGDDDLTIYNAPLGQVFFSALIGVAGNAGRIDVAFEFRQEMESMGVTPGLATCSALMRVCSNVCEPMSTNLSNFVS